MKNLNIKQLRKKAGYTQKQVAEQTKTSINYISMLENGQRNPSDKMKSKLAELYNCQITDIFLALQTTKCNMKINKEG